MTRSPTEFATRGRPIGINAVGEDRGDQPSLVRTVAAVSVALIVVLAQLGLILAPSQLGRNPLLVLALRPTPAFLVLVGDLVAPATAMLMASISRTLVDMAYFAVARYGALPLAQRFGVGRNLTRGMSGRTAGRGLLAVAFVWSSTPVVAALGLGRTSILTFLAVTGVGNVVTSSLFVASGRQFSVYVAPITAWMSAHGGPLTAALGGAVALSLLVALRRSSRGSAGKRT